MKKCIIIPDSFKGSLDSSDICSIISEEVLKQFPECETVSLPIADGGVGTIDCITKTLKWDIVEVDTVGPFGDPVTAKYAVSKKDKTSIIECAQAVGMDLAQGRLDPSTASTYGVGLIIKDSIKRGYTNIILALGGCCTTDGGAGCAAALGVKFTDYDDNEFIPCGKTLCNISHIDVTVSNSLLNGCKIGAMCDVLTTLHGPNGTASVYSPQKGADMDMVAMLDKNLQHFDMKLKSELGKDLSKIEGSGACGGFGATIIALFNGKLKSGINYMLDIMDFDLISENADMIITGEGCLDSISLKGKTVYGIAQRVRKLGLKIPVVAIVGRNKLDFETTARAGISSVVPITPSYMQYEEARIHAPNNLRNAVVKMLVTRGLFLN